MQYVCLVSLHKNIWWIKNMHNLRKIVWSSNPTACEVPNVTNVVLPSFRVWVNPGRSVWSWRAATPRSPSTSSEFPLSNFSWLCISFLFLTQFSCYKTYIRSFHVVPVNYSNLKTVISNKFSTILKFSSKLVLRPNLLAQDKHIFVYYKLNTQR